MGMVKEPQGLGGKAEGGYQPKWGNEKKIRYGAGYGRIRSGEEDRMRNLVPEESSSSCPCNHWTKKARMQENKRICSSGRNTDL